MCLPLLTSALCEVFVGVYLAFLYDYLAAADTIISSVRQDLVTRVLLKTGGHSSPAQLIQSLLCVLGALL